MRRLGLPASVLLLSAFALGGCAAVPRAAPKLAQDLARTPVPEVREAVATSPPTPKDVSVDAPGDGEAVALQTVADAPPPPPSAVHAATFDFPASASDWEAIARDTKASPSERADALVEAASLARALGDSERMKRLQKLAASIALPPATATKVAWLGASVDYVAWSTALPDEGDNRRHRIAAIAAVRAFWETEHAKRSAAPWVVEASFAMTELLRAEPAERDTWLRRVGDAWAVVDAPSASGAKMERDPSVIDHASTAALELLRHQVDAKLTGWVARCEASTPAALLGTPDPLGGWTKGQFEADLAPLEALDEQLGKASAAFKDAAGYGAWFDARGQIFATAADCVDTAIQSLASSIGLGSPLMLSLQAGSMTLTPTQRLAVTLDRRARERRDVLHQVAMRDLAIALALSPDGTDRLARNYLATWSPSVNAPQTWSQHLVRGVVNPRSGQSVALVARYDPIGIPTPISAQPVVIAWLPDRP